MVGITQDILFRQNNINGRVAAFDDGGIFVDGVFQLVQIFVELRFAGLGTDSADLMLEVMALGLQGDDALMAHFVVAHFVADKVVHGTVFVAEAVQLRNHQKRGIVENRIQQGAQIIQEQRIFFRRKHMAAEFKHHLQRYKHGGQQYHQPDGSVVGRILDQLLVQKILIK